MATARSARASSLIATRRDVGASRVHPLVAGGWFATTLAMIFLTSNPLYVATIGLAAVAVYAGARQERQRALDYVLLLGAIASLVTVPLNLISGSSGATALLDVPELRTPAWLGRVVLGGDVTAESLVYAATQATSIAAILAVVCAFNASADLFRLLKGVPAGFAQLGVVVSVGLLLVPETIRRVATLREARIVRGHRESGARAVLALLLPLLSDALERALQRAESLDARGFGRLAARPSPIATAGAVAGVAMAAAGSFSLYYAGGAAWSLALFAAGGVAVGVSLWLRGGERTTRLRREGPDAWDVAVLCASAAALSIFAASRALGVGGMTYLPFPEIFVPAYEPLPAVACVLLATPLLSQLVGARP